MTGNLWIQTEPLNKFSHAIRALRESLLAHFPDDRSPVIVLCSPHKGEGCSTLAANLAASFAHSGKRTLIIDGDISDKGLEIHFQVSVETGFADIISGGSGGPAQTGIENLYFLPAGSVPNEKHPFDLPLLKEILEKFRSEYEIILIDTAPILDSSDPVVIGQKASGVLIVFQAGSFSREDEITAREILDRSGIRIIGAVINRIRREDQDPYYTYQRFMEMKDK